MIFVILRTIVMQSTIQDPRQRLEKAVQRVRRFRIAYDGKRSEVPHNVNTLRLMLPMTALSQLKSVSSPTLNRQLAANCSHSPFSECPLSELCATDGLLLVKRPIRIFVDRLEQIIRWVPVTALSSYIVAAQTDNFFLRPKPEFPTVELS